MNINLDHDIILHAYNNVQQNNSTVAEYMQVLDNLHEYIKTESNIDIDDHYNTVRFCKGLRAELKEQVARINNINRERALKIATFAEQNKFAEVYNWISQYNTVAPDKNW